jgi:iron complex outermembrane recepter protein
MNIETSRTVALGACMVCAAFPALAQALAQSGEESAAAVDEIVVTAQRYEESAQRSSLAIQVLSDQELQRAVVTQATDLNRIVPGLQIGTGGGASQIYIRGVGDFAASALSNPAVAVNVDGVYVSRPQGVNSSFYDLARIEVVKGPQGTLYGRNASGGALNLITNRPSLDAFDGNLGATLGDYDLKQFEGAVNVPLSGSVAIRGAFSVTERDGYLSDGTDDEDKKAARIRLLWQPNDAVSLLLTADGAKEEGKGPGYVQLPRAGGSDPWRSASSPEANAILAATPPIGFLVSPIAADNFRDNEFWNISAELNWNFGPATLTVLPAYRDARFSERNYPAGLRNTIPEATSEQTTLEVRLSNATDALKWVAGLYYYDEDQEAEQLIFQGFLQDQVGNYFPKTRSYAAFGQATFSVSDSLRLIAGARYTDEDRSVSGTLFTNTPNGLPPGTPLPALIVAFGGKRSFSDTTWKAGVEYDITPDNMLFLTASTGFKAGGFNQTVAPLDTYEPEKLRAYELGSRNRFFDGRLQLNVELFSWDYEDNQIAHVIFDPLGNINLVTQNAGEATIRGANVDLQAAPTANDRLRAFVEYNDASYDTFTYDTAFSIFGTPLFNPASTGCPVGAPFAGSLFGTLLITVNCSGLALPRAPKWSASVGYEHTFRFAGGASLNAAVSGNYASERYTGFEFVRSQLADASETFDFDVTYVSGSGKWSLGAFVHNIGDEPVYTGGSVQGFAPPLVYATIGPPRTYGVRARYNFD